MPASFRLLPLALVLLAACGSAVAPGSGDAQASTDAQSHPDAVATTDAPATSADVIARLDCDLPWGGTCGVEQTCSLDRCAVDGTTRQDCTCISPGNLQCSASTCPTRGDGGTSTCTPPGGSCLDDASCCGVPCVDHLCQAGATGSFACGPSLHCTVGIQFCQRVLDDTGMPDTYACPALPDQCFTSTDCDCLRSTGCGSCTNAGPGRFTQVCGGG